MDSLREGISISANTAGQTQERQEDLIFEISLDYEICSSPAWPPPNCLKTTTEGRGWELGDKRARSGVLASRNFFEG